MCEVKTARYRLTKQRGMAAAAVVALKHAKTTSLDEVPAISVPPAEAILKHGKLGRQTIAPSGTAVTESPVCRQLTIAAVVLACWSRLSQVASKSKAWLSH